MANLDIPAEQMNTPGTFAFGHYIPEIAEAAFAYSRSVYLHSRLSHREFEGARIRTAQINGCRACQAWRGERDTPAYLAAAGELGTDNVVNNGPAPDDAFYDAVESWRTASLFSPRERLAIEFAERMGLDPKGLSSDAGFWDRARALFSNAEILDLTLSIGSWMALGRAMHVLSFDDRCAVPEPAAQVSAAAA